MIEDEAYVARLLEIFEADDPDDGIDRHDGWGRDFGVRSMRVVASDDGFDDLEVEVWCTVPWFLRWRHRPGTATTRTLFDRQWRVDSGYERPEDFAEVVAREAYLAAVEMYEKKPERPGDLERARREVGSVDALWVRLRELLAQEGDVVEERPGHLQVRGRAEGPPVYTRGFGDFEPDVPRDFRVHLTPEQWHEYVAGSEVLCWHDSGVDAAEPGDGFGWACFALEEEIGSLWEDEHHVVHFRGGLHGSTREELPPVRGRVFDSEVEAGLDEGGGWYAHDMSGHSLEAWQIEEGAPGPVARWFRRWTRRHQG